MTAWYLEMWAPSLLLNAWSVVHFLAGVSFALLARHWRQKFWSSLIAAEVLFVLWELFENYVQHVEPFTNHLADIIIETAGFLIAWYVYPKLKNAPISGKSSASASPTSLSVTA